MEYIIPEAQIGYMLDRAICTLAGRAVAEICKVLPRVGTNPLYAHLDILTYFFQVVGISDPPGLSLLANGLDASFVYSPTT